MSNPSGPPGPDDPTRPSGWADGPVVPGVPPARPAPGPGPASSSGPAGWAAAPGSPGPGGGWGAPPPTDAGGAPASSPGGRGRLRIVGRALVVLVVLAALGGLTAWGLANRSSAQEWRERSEAADARLEESLDQVETTAAEVDDAREQLRELAAEKAGETDRNRILSDIVAQAPEVTAALRDCQQETTDLTNDIIASVGDPSADVASIQRRISEVNDICDDALAESSALEDSIDELGL